MSNECKLAPTGWRCTREAGHTGPCAAVGAIPTEEGPKTVLGNDKVLKHFAFEHLPGHLQAVSRPFQSLAYFVHHNLQAGPERSVALRKLLEAKDAAVRAAVHPGG